MFLNQDLIKTLRSLRLSGLIPALPARIAQAKSDHLDPAEFLQIIFQDELDKRKDRLLERRIKSARINPDKRLDNFDFSFNPKIQKNLVMELATTRFIAQTQNVIVIGPPGTGKSHIAQAIALCAVQAGHKALYYQLHEILDLMIEANATGARKPLVQKLLNPNLLILDDLGMKKLAPDRAEELLEIIMRRYENPPPSLPLTAHLRTGLSSLATLPLLLPSSTDSCTTPSCSPSMAKATGSTKLVLIRKLQRIKKMTTQVSRKCRL